MSRTPNGNGNGHSYEQPHTPPDPKSDAPRADETDKAAEDGDAETMPLNNLAFRCMIKTDHTMTMCRYLADAFYDDNNQIDHLFKELVNLLRPVVSDLCMLEERLQRETKTR